MLTDFNVARQSAEADIQIDMDVFSELVSVVIFMHFGAQSGHSENGIGFFSLLTRPRPH
jgi:hypothetical protein